MLLQCILFFHDTNGQMAHGHENMWSVTQFSGHQVTQPPLASSQIYFCISQSNCVQIMCPFLFYGLQQWLQKEEVLISTCYRDEKIWFQVGSNCSILVKAISFVPYPSYDELFYLIIFPSHQSKYIIKRFLSFFCSTQSALTHC